MLSVAVELNGGVGSYDEGGTKGGEYIVLGEVANGLFGCNHSFSYFLKPRHFRKVLLSYNLIKYNIHYH